jgi:hypothetical protein
LEKLRCALGHSHPDTINLLDKLAGSTLRHGDHHRALLLFEESLSLRKQVFGDHHPSTTVSLNNIAVFWYKRGEWSRALELYDACLAQRLRMLGAHHPLTKLNSKWRDICASKLQHHNAASSL